MNYSVSGSNLWNELIENTGNSTPERWHILKKNDFKDYRITLYCIYFVLVSIKLQNDIDVLLYCC